jgi:hypothetical protein
MRPGAQDFPILGGQTWRPILDMTSLSVFKNNDGFGNGAAPHLGGQKKNFSPLRGKKNQNRTASVNVEIKPLSSL